MIIILTNCRQAIKEKMRFSYLNERKKCYQSFRKVFHPNTKFSERIKETKYICENYSYFTESFECLLMIFYLLPYNKNSQEYFSEISDLYSQICRYFGKSEYFSFFNTQMARFLCSLSLKGDLKYFQITNLVLKNLKKTFI